MRETLCDGNNECFRLSAEIDEAYGYLSRLFVECAPQCQPLPSLPGLATQIDNYISGLHQQRDALLAALKAIMTGREGGDKWHAHVPWHLLAEAAGVLDKAEGRA